MSQPGESWLADIVFTSGLAAKRRPVLVLKVDGPDSLVATVVSSAPRTETDVSLSDWAVASLRRQSTVRLFKLDTLVSSRLVGRIGRVSPEDAERLNEAWATHMRLAL